MIWGARNDLVFEKVFIAPELCFKRATDILTEYRKAVASDQCTTARRPKASWSPPAHGFIKLNVDAATKPQEDRIGLGVVARDKEGTVFLSASKTDWPFISVERAELEAFQWAVDLAIDSGWQNVIVEGDAQTIVRALQGSISRSY